MTPPKRYHIGVIFSDFWSFHALQEMPKVLKIQLFLTLLENRDPQGIHVVNSTLEAFQKNTFLIHAWVHALLKFGQNPREYFVNLATNPFPQW